MKLHIFNPEHDIALAANMAHFTAPHAGRQLRHDLGYLPVLWADEDDIVLVDDVDTARKEFERIQPKVSTGQAVGFSRSNHRFQTPKVALSSIKVDGFEPWGWDLALRESLLRCGADMKSLPTTAQLEIIRQLSHRRIAAKVLTRMKDSDKTSLLVGEAFECRTAEEVNRLTERFGHVVLKAPWSSSGRGIRFVDSQQKPATLSGWLRHLLDAQGCVMLEPYYNNVKDLGMEFSCLPDGQVRYDGLSLFDTMNGAYTGNIVATETAKCRMISRYISSDKIDDIQSKLSSLLEEVINGQYVGALGVDMMIVANGHDFLVHPCVEINLRRTMGHVALSLSKLCNPHNDEEVVRVMRIEFADNKYKLKILKQ